MRGSVVNRGKGVWELRISMGYDAKGKQIRKTKRVRATSKRAAEKELEKFVWAVEREVQTDEAHKNLVNLPRFGSRGITIKWRSPRGCHSALFCMIG